MIRSRKCRCRRERHFSAVKLFGFLRIYFFQDIEAIKWDSLIFPAKIHHSLILTSNFSKQSQIVCAQQNSQKIHTSLGGTPPLTQFVPSNFTHTITHRPSNFPWEVLAPHFLHCQTQVLRSFELQNTPPPHSLNLFTPTNPTGSKVPIQTFQERSRATRWEMSTNVQRTFAGDSERCAQTFRERSREELS